MNNHIKKIRHGILYIGIPSALIMLISSTLIQGFNNTSRAAIMVTVLFAALYGIVEAFALWKYRK